MLKDEEPSLEGAQAEDPEAEYILDILENHTTTGKSSLANFGKLIVRVCERQDKYNNPEIQGVAVIALLRYKTKFYVFKHSLNFSNLASFSYVILNTIEYAQVTVNIALYFTRH